MLEAVVTTWDSCLVTRLAVSLRGGPTPLSMWRKI
jgi:hypothetical protein